jgi:AbiU2
MTGIPETPRKDRLRIVVILCCSFGRNLAYYRAWWGKEHEHFLSLANAHPIFWRAVNNNFLDMCVLEWCKLFAAKSGKHYWGNIVTDAQKFEADLLRHLGCDAAAFEKEIKTMRHYRDKFVAHQDLEYTVILPTLDVAKKAVWFYHAHIVNHEVKPGDLSQLPVDIERGYDYEEQEARAVYRGIR